MNNMEVVLPIMLVLIIIGVAYYVGYSNGQMAGARKTTNYFKQICSKDSPKL